MQMTPRIKGLKSLQRRFQDLTSPQLVEEAKHRTIEELRGFKTRPSLRFVNHVFRGILREVLRRSPNKKV